MLGRAEVRRRGGEAVDFKSRKALALLAYLAVENKSTHSREHLATLLWGRTGEERARHNLRQALSRIRACCESLLLVDGDSIGIDAKSCAVDVIEFEELSGSSDPEGLRRSLAAYGGDLLTGINVREPVFEEWLLPARARLRQSACGVADALVSQLIAIGQLDEAMQVLDHRLKMDPACEAAHCQLMQVYLEVGRRSDALRQYQTCVDALRRELDAQPGPEISALFRQIRESGTDVGEAALGSEQGLSQRPRRERPTVAVLPFDNLSIPDDAYFVDGIAEDLITALSRFNSLSVLARGSSFRYRGLDVPDRQIADELDAQFLVRGSLRRSGKHVRISVQLIDAVGEQTLWADRFDRELEDVFVVQDEITSTLVSILAGQVEAARLANARKATPDRLDAYDILLRGKDHHHRFTAEDCRECVSLFERAVEKDPDYALAHAWLACGLGQAMVFNPKAIPELIDRSEAAARRGLELDENESECHRLLAQIALTRKDPKRSLWHQERALFLNPNDDRSVCSMGEILSFLGRHEEAEQWVRKSMKLNPYHPQRYWTHLARPLFHLGRYQEALQALDNISRLRSDDHVYRIASLARMPDAEACADALGQLLKAQPEFIAGEFVESLPFDRSEDRQALVDAIESAGLKVGA